jgi:hypothetical protein
MGIWGKVGKGDVDGNNGNEEGDEDGDGIGMGMGMGIDNGDWQWEGEQEWEGDGNELLTIFCTIYPHAISQILYVPCKRHTDVYYWKK